MSITELFYDNYKIGYLKKKEMKMTEVINNLYKCYIEVNHMDIDIKTKNIIKREIFKAIQGLFELELYNEHGKID